MEKSSSMRTRSSTEEEESSEERCAETEDPLNCSETAISCWCNAEKAAMECGSWTICDWGGRCAMRKAETTILSSSNDHLPGDGDQQRLLGRGRHWLQKD